MTSRHPYASLACVAVCLGTLAGPSWGQCATQAARLTEPEGVSGDAFGHGVAVRGDWAIVGAHAGKSASGAAFVFHRVGGVWTAAQTLEPPGLGPGDYFGYAAAISDGYAALGAWGDDEAGTDAGAVYLYRRDGDTWVFDAKVTPGPGSTDVFLGGAVALDGDRLLAGATGDTEDGTNAGSAWFFKRTGPGAWTSEGTVVSDAGTPFGLFGTSVALSGDTAVVGEPNAFDGDGAAHAFRFAGGAWTHEDVLATPAYSLGQLGKRVALDGGRALLGADGADYGGPTYGAAFVFLRGAGGLWSREAMLVPDAGIEGETVGLSVAMRGGLALLGAVAQDEEGNEVRALYAFRQDGTGWVDAGRITPDEPDPSEVFGYTLSLDGGVVLAGALVKSGFGAAYIFDVTACAPCRADCNGDGKLSINDFLCFQAEWRRKSAYGDFNGDGLFNVNDFIGFQAAWRDGAAHGCG